MVINGEILKHYINLDMYAIFKNTTTVNAAHANVKMDVNIVKKCDFV